MSAQGAIQGHLFSSAEISVESLPFEGFNPDEQTLLRHLHQALPPIKEGKPIGPPLLRNGEDDLVVRFEDGYLSEVAKRAVPLDSPLPQRQREAKRRQGMGAARRQRGGIALDRLMTTAHGLDVCRSIVRSAQGRGFIPVSESVDTEASAVAWSAEYVETTLHAGYERRDIRGGNTQRTISRLMERYPREREVRLELGTVTGINMRRKLEMWINFMVQITEGGQGKARFTQAQKDEFLAYAMERPEEYRNRPDLIVRVAGLIAAKRAGTVVTPA
jgi:hypothetical protein